MNMAGIDDTSYDKSTATSPTSPVRQATLLLLLHVFALSDGKIHHAMMTFALEIMTAMWQAVRLLLPQRSMSLGLIPVAAMCCRIGVSDMNDDWIC